ncbi:E3 ubiquitin-protein ligase TRIM35-like isoform X3 [Myxocyprinus asiaticus]|nr:E3 ubiquitin-protein ligase TRIM35-like isoform X3 [Myxocyprinus asiaticus]
MSANLPEEDLSCPVCCEIFKHPVLLPCSHSFCRSCLEHFWDSASSRSCPVCRRRASKKSPPSNRALKNLCEAFLLGRGQGNASGSNTLCWRHGEKFKLFCLVDQEPICVVCQASKMHKGHDCSPTEEAALDCKDKLSAAMKVLQHKLEVFSKARQSSAFTLEYIKIQAQRVERQMKEEFLKLHQFLYEEEERRLSSLMEEEAHRVEAMKNRDDDIAWRISSLTDMLSTMEQTINAEDLTLLQNFKATNEGSWSTLQDPECVSGSLLDEPKYLGNLKYKVWQKMQAVAKYTHLDAAECTATFLEPSALLCPHRGNRDRRVLASSDPAVAMEAFPLPPTLPAKDQRSLSPATSAHCQGPWRSFPCYKCSCSRPWRPPDIFPALEPLNPLSAMVPPDLMPCSLQLPWSACPVR